MGINQFYLLNISYLSDCYILFSVWDASAQSTTGILRGSIFQMGDWDECLSVTGPISTQYCLVTLKASIRNQSYERDPVSLYYSPYDTVLDRLYVSEYPQNPKRSVREWHLFPYLSGLTILQDHKDVSQQTRHVVQMGLCVPGGCPISDLENSVNSYLSSLSNPYMDQNLSYKAVVAPSLCQSTKERTTFDHLDIAFWYVPPLILIIIRHKVEKNYVTPISKVVYNKKLELGLQRLYK